MELFFIDKYYETHHAIKIAETKYRNSEIDRYQKEIDELDKNVPLKESKKQWNIRFDTQNDLKDRMSKIVNEKKISKKASIDIEFRNSEIIRYNNEMNELDIALDKTKSSKDTIDMNYRHTALQRNLKIIMREKYLADERRANEEEEDKYL